MCEIKHKCSAACRVAAAPAADDDDDDDAAAAAAASNLFGKISRQQMGRQRTIEKEYQMIATSKHIDTH